MRARVARAIDRDGLEIDPAELEGVPQLRKLSAEYQATLIELIGRWWPQAGFGSERDDDSAPASHAARRARSAVMIGADLEAPLSTDQWAQLLTAHLALAWISGASDRPVLAADSD